MFNFSDLGSSICRDVHQSPADVLCLPEESETLTLLKSCTVLCTSVQRIMAVLTIHMQSTG